ncbi:MAG: hypothetical protein GY910_17110 [bacterium]|nr:hypothetical protein [Deltaproteobacteria bacterium]MCP4906697.1 hypothetical protein [bacterium]
MLQQDPKRRTIDGQTLCGGPSEPQIHTEHRAALDATLFRSASDLHELVLELDSGELRLRTPDES